MVEEKQKQEKKEVPKVETPKKVPAKVDSKEEVKKEPAKVETPVKEQAPKKKVPVKKGDHDLAKVNSYGVPISTKQSYEICNFIRERKLEQAKRLLNEVLSMKKAVPFKRYNRDMGHKPSIASGRYPKKASEHFLKLLNAAEANAENLGLDTKNLVIKDINASLGSAPWHGGRKRRRKMKRTNISIVVKEMEK